jgi:hypothetical protein
MTALVTSELTQDLTQGDTEGGRRINQSINQRNRIGDKPDGSDNNNKEKKDLNLKALRSNHSSRVCRTKSLTGKGNKKGIKQSGLQGGISAPASGEGAPTIEGRGAVEGRPDRRRGRRIWRSDRAPTPTLVCGS